MTGQFPRQCSGRAVHLDRGHRIKLQPDLSWWERGRCLWVGDAKYKQVTSGGEPNADTYQAVAYCLGAGVEHATLIYASDLGAGGAVHIKAGGPTIERVGLDLSLAPGALLEQVHKLAVRVRSQACATPPEEAREASAINPHHERLAACGGAPRRSL